MRTASLFALLKRDARGAMAVETALVAPVLALMALGTYDVSNIVAKQQDLQSGASEATEIVLAAAGGSGVSSDKLTQIITSSLGLTDGQVTIAQRFRCDDGDLVAEMPACSGGKPIYQFVQLTITDTYTPLWTNFGVGGPMDFSVVRTVQTA